MSAEEPASWQIRFADAEGNNKLGAPVAEFHTVQTSSAAKGYPADRDALALPAMPATNAAVDGTTGGRIEIWAKGDAADTVESEESNGHIPIKLIHKATGAITARQLRVGDDGSSDFSGFNSTDDVALVTTEYRKLGHYSVPAGFIATLDPGKPVHLYLGDDT